MHIFNFKFYMNIIKLKSKFLTMGTVMCSYNPDINQELEYINSENKQITNIYSKPNKKYDLALKGKMLIYFSKI